jgi:hypothetical protein
VAHAGQASDRGTRRAGRHALSLACAFPGGENTALFDRCGDALAEADLGPLASWRSDAGDLDIADILDAQRWGLV